MTRIRNLIGRTIAVVALVGAAPLMLAVAVTTALSLGRPVLFRQQRAGLGGRPFKMVKFRTMQDLRDRNGELLPDDARLSAIGRFLRRTRLDELPELANILRGEMNWVGPRPLLPETVQAFGTLGQKRGAIPPGLTGWAQVNGNSMLTADQKLLLDLWYVDNRNIRLDLVILLSTLRVIVAGERVNYASLEQ